MMEVVSAKSNPMILVTGASGTVGRAVTESLLAQGLALRAQVRNRAQFLSLMGTKLDGANLEIRECDFTNIAEREFGRLVEGCGAIVHLAALVHQPQAAFEAYELVNVRTTRQLAEAARAQGVHTFVFLSTANVYGEGPFDYICEDALLKPVSPYAVSKANSEQWLKSQGGFNKLVILRPPLVFGEGDRGNLLKIIRQINRGLYFHIGVKPIKKSLIYSYDMANAIGLCLTKLSEGIHIYNVANPQPIELKELTEQISASLGKSSKLPTVPQSVVEFGAVIAQKILKKKAPLTVAQIKRLTTTTTCSVAEFVKATDFRPMFTFSEALRNEISWAKSVGLL